MIAINELEKLAKSKHDESVRFRTYLKTHANEEELDKAFKKLHDKYFKIYDCSKCRNCCKELGVSIGYDEIDKLHLSKEQLSNLKDNFGNYVNKNNGCPFLNSNNECVLKDNLPLSCKEYPYTNKPERLESLYTVINNTFICPAVYEIVEELKKKYNFKIVR